MDTEKKFDDAMQEWFKQQSLLAQQVKVEGDHIIVNVHYEYNINVQDCNSYEKILQWAWQLSTKNWATKEIIMAFIRVACSYHGLKHTM